MEALPSGFLQPRRAQSQAVRILVVEDDQLLSRSLQRGLQADGYRVDVAADGTLGLHLASENDSNSIRPATAALSGAAIWT
jgi:ActR/RegA family two-component response regulator